MILTFKRGANDFNFLFFATRQNKRWYQWQSTASLGIRLCTHGCLHDWFWDLNHLSKQEDQEMRVTSCFLGVRICTTLQLYSADYAVPRLLLQDGQCPGNREIENELKWPGKSQGIWERKIRIVEFDSPKVSHSFHLDGLSFLLDDLSFCKNFQLLTIDLQELCSRIYSPVLLDINSLGHQQHG